MLCVVALRRFPARASLLNAPQALLCAKAHALPVWFVTRRTVLSVTIVCNLAVKLAVQIVVGILVSVAASWLMCMMVFAVSLGALSHAVSQATVKIAATPVAVYHTPKPVPVPVVPAAAECRNFVQMVGGRRRCLASTAVSEFRVEDR